MSDDARQFRLAGPDRVLLVATRAGRGVPVVFVHGPDPSSPLIPRLVEHHEVWSYARRGYPPSADGPRATTLADDVTDLAAVVDACGATPHLVGEAFGAIVALHHALQHPGRIRSLTLIDPPPTGPQPAPDAVLIAARAAELDTLATDTVDADHADVGVPSLIVRGGDAIAVLDFLRNG